MQRSVWMRPALQKSEAVLLPALQRYRIGEPQFSDPYYYISSVDNPFLPIEGNDFAVAVNTPAQEVTALSTYVRPRGSMAGRSVLRAAGISENRWLWPVSRPTYYQPSQNKTKPVRKLWR